MSPYTEIKKKRETKCCDAKIARNFNFARVAAAAKSPVKSLWRLLTKATNEGSLSRRALDDVACCAEGARVQSSETVFVSLSKGGSTGNAVRASGLKCSPC